VSAIQVNGSDWEGPPGATVADLVGQWCASPKGVAVARNGEVVPKSRWGDTPLALGDHIEIVTAVAGG
jgi:sulfur carrier protein